MWSILACGTLTRKGYNRGVPLSAAIARGGNNKDPAAPRSSALAVRREQRSSSPPLDVVMRIPPLKSKFAYLRSPLKNSRTSAVIAAGCSQKAKCPPFARCVKRTKLK